MSTVKQNLFPASNNPHTDTRFTETWFTETWLSGFLLLGIFLAALGSLLIVWNYHIDGDPRLVGLHFLGLSAGYGIGSHLGQRRSWRGDPRRMALLACSAGFAGVLALSFLGPPASLVWRILILATVGLAGGVLASALLFALEPAYAAQPGRTLTKSGVYFGAGCLLATLGTGLTYLAAWHRGETVLLSVVPLVFLLRYARLRPAVFFANPPSDSTEDLRLVAAFLFTMLLLVQFGNEWAMAGWLPLFLIHILGSSPGYAILALGVYFFALTLGRLLAQRVVERLSQSRLLIASMVVALAGYLLLSMAQSLADAYMGIVITAVGFGPIYPLVLKTLDERFNYQAGFYNRILSIAITGGLSVPWLLGYVDASFGMRAVMLLPALGSVAVLVLALLIMLEARLMGGPGISEQSNLV